MRTGTRLIVGMGATGLSVARHLLRAGLPIAVTDSRADPPQASALKNLAEVPASFGAFSSPAPVAELCEAVVSPGVSLAEPFIQQLRDAGVPIVGDIELFARALQPPVAPVIAITGSNGKSTVTAMVAAMAQAAGKHAAVGGNFGTPALDLLGTDPDFYVLELSSFQLELTESLAPAAAVVLNVSADHIDRHASLAHYAALKARIYRGAGIAVINGDDPAVVAMATSDATRVVFGDEQGDWRLAQHAGQTWLCRGDDAWIAARDLTLRGRHNWSNALAAMALGEAAGVSQAAMLAGLRGFQGLPHRCQFVAEVGGVEWVDDSKATNVGALLASLAGFAGPMVLLAGGQAKGADFSPLGPALARNGRAVVLFGADAAILAHAVQGYVPVARVPGLRAAVTRAAHTAEPGDTVLLSPGCASFDQFRDFADRGEQFVAAVRELAA